MALASGRVAPSAGRSSKHWCTVLPRSFRACPATAAGSGRAQMLSLMVSWPRSCWHGGGCWPPRTRVNCPTGSPPSHHRQLRGRSSLQLRSRGLAVTASLAQVLTSSRRGTPSCHRALSRMSEPSSSCRLPYRWVPHPAACLMAAVQFEWQPGGFAAAHRLHIVGAATMLVITLIASPDTCLQHGSMKSVQYCALRDSRYAARSARLEE